MLIKCDLLKWEQVTSDFLTFDLVQINSERQLNQYFKFVKDMLLEDVIIEPLIHHAYYVNQNLHSIQGLDRVMSMYMIIAYTVGLYCLKPVRCCWRLVPCYARASCKYACDFGFS